MLEIIVLVLGLLCLFLLLLLFLQHKNVRCIREQLPYYDAPLPINPCIVIAISKNVTDVNQQRVFHLPTFKC